MICGGRQHMFSLIGQLIFGAIVGVIAKFLMPGKDPGGWIITILLGIAGSWLGGYLGKVLGWYQEGQAAGLIVSTIGAIILLALYRLVVGKGGGGKAKAAGA